MNYELSRSKGKIRGDSPGNNRTVSYSQTTLQEGSDVRTIHEEDRFSHSKPLKEFKVSIDQLEWGSIHEPRWFGNKYFYWSHFKRGLFWGTVVSFTAILSAGCGVALTKVDSIENAIAQRISSRSSPGQIAKQLPLTTPLNVLLIEVDRNDKAQIQNVLVLKLDPRIGFAKVINIPADSRIELSGGGWRTVADAYRDGGIKLISRSIEELMNDVKIDRYLKADSGVFEYLATRVKVSLTHCEQVIPDCSSTSEQIQWQEGEFEVIRQRLRVPAYFTNFAQTVAKIKPNLDSNLSVQEFVSIADFVRELKGNNVSINFLPQKTEYRSPGYTSSEAILIDKL